MGKFSDILFTADFDHTLSGPDGSVPQSNIDAIRYFIAEGGRFCINSGRSLELLRGKLEIVPVNAPCICFNGAACYDYATETLLYAVPLPDNAPELVQKLLNLGQDFGIEIQRLDGHYSCRASGRDTFLRQQGITPVAATQDLPLPWIKLALCGTDREDVLSGQATPAQDARMTQLRQQVLELCGDTCYVVRSLPLLLEIGSRKSDKGMAARRLADSLGRRVLVCAGDAPNDLQMLENADIAFVPSDAAAQMLTLPRVRITAPSGEGCIADAIAQLEAISPERR